MDDKKEEYMAVYKDETKNDHTISASLKPQSKSSIAKPPRHSGRYFVDGCSIELRPTCRIWYH